MNKMNKKGFTLIEMLVVIAIIAVLVSIIIPVVGNSTAKAKAATDAANLRSVKATLTIAALTEEPAALAEATAPTKVPDAFNAPKSKTNGNDMTYTYTNNTITVYYGTETIASLAGTAGGATEAAEDPAGGND